MISSVHDYNLDEVFKKNANFYYQIPKYQREYVWGKQNWEHLFDDIVLDNTGFQCFIGSIICINKTNDSYDASPLEVVDGQQRLTTISLLLTAIYNQLKQFKDAIDDNDADVLPSLRKSLACDKSPNHLALVLQSQGNNESDFEYIMSQNGFLDEMPRPKNVGKRRISKCYNYFLSRLNEIIDTENSPEKKAKRLIGIKNSIDETVLVKIEVNNHAEAYTLFEALNDRGTPLTAVDLIKNCMLARADQLQQANSSKGTNDNEQLDAYFRKWQTLLDYISDDYSVQERFFRQYYNAFREQLNEPFKANNKRVKYPLGNLATRSNLLVIYEKLIESNLPLFISSILPSAKIYSQLILNNDDESASPFRQELINLDHIQGAPSYLLLLYLLREQSNLGLTDKTIQDIINLLAKFFVRRNITDTPGTRHLTRNFMQMVTDINSSQIATPKIYDYIRSSLIEQSADDATFEEKLRGDIYEENSNAARYILCDVAQHGMTNETWTDLWSKNDYGSTKVYKWTIEHILPEGKNIPDSWVNMIAAGDRNLADKYLTDYVHKLGNLTITGYNSTLGNKSFTEKRDRKNAKGAFIGYKNGLSINNDLADKESWTIDDIVTRTDRLVAKAMAMYRL